MAILARVFLNDQERGTIPAATRLIQDNLIAAINQPQSLERFIDLYPPSSTIGGMIAAFLQNTPLWDRLVSIVYEILVEEHEVPNPFPLNANGRVYEYLNPQQQEALLVHQHPLVRDLLTAANGLVHTFTSQSR